MPFNATQFCTDHNIPTAPPGHRHGRVGWVNVACPYCSGNIGFHLGLNAAKGYASCYRCGGHWLPKVVATLLKTTPTQAKHLLTPYLTGEQIHEFKEKHYAEKIIFPPDTGPINAKQRAYLSNRHFDPDKLEQEWDVLGVGRVGPYKGRILIPIYLHNDLVSYQTRDITDKHSSKYMACPEDEEVYCHKYTLYGIDNCNSKIAMVTEGIFDVWRMGIGTVGTSGINYSPQQVLMLAQQFDRIFIFYDNEEQAQQKADEMAADLYKFGKECEIITNPNGDPGDLTDDDAKNLMREVGL